MIEPSNEGSIIYAGNRMSYFQTIARLSDVMLLAI
jgi:hypothetical protein